MKRAAFLAALAAVTSSPGFARASTSTRIEAIARAIPGVMGACCRTLGDGPPAFTYNAGTSFPAASTIKVLIMAAAFDAQEREAGALRATIVFRRSDLIGGSDYLASMPDGTRLRAGDLLVPMIQLSDNTASNLLISYLGFDAINAVGTRAGMSATRLARHFVDGSEPVAHNENVTTPRDMASLLFHIARGAHEGVPTIASADHCRRMVRIMLGQTDRATIPAGLPQHVAVANKTGEISGVRNDVAIVSPFGEAPYVLTVYTKWLNDEGPAYAAIRRLARLSYGLVG